MQVKFVDNMLKGRSTQSKFDDHILDYIKIDNGIGQGDSLLMVLYQYYNADLLDVPTSPSEFAAAYIDDAILVATAKTFEETHKMLVNMMTREDGTQKWVKDHNSKFELLKLAMIDFTLQCKKHIMISSGLDD